MSACSKEKDESNNNVPSPVLAEISITEFECFDDSGYTTVSATIVDKGLTVTRKGLVLIKDASVIDPENGVKVDDTSSGNTVSMKFRARDVLGEYTTFHISAFVENKNGINYADWSTWDLCVTGGAVITSDITDIKSNSATSGGMASSSVAIIEQGVVWSTSVNPTVTDNKTIDGNGGGTFSSSITDLDANTKYYLRAYIIEEVGIPKQKRIVYGDEKEFTTLSGNLPLVKTYSNVTVNTNHFTVKGSVLNNGGANISDKGFVISLSQNPTLGDSTISLKLAADTAFSSYITVPKYFTVYHIRAYATNSAGTSYGEEVSPKSLKAIGSVYQGGKIYYLDPSGYGLIAGVDQGYSIYGCGGTKLNSSSASNGSLNTQVIVNGCTGSSAAGICSSLSLNGYSDWYLPSKDELYLLTSMRTALGLNSNDSWWSSTEVDKDFAWYLSPGSGTNMMQNLKTSNLKVLPVRRFNY